MIVDDGHVCTFEPQPTADSVFWYYQNDHLGSSSVITDRSGVLVKQYGYKAYGDQRYSWEKTASMNLSNRFTGQILDEDTGLYYYGARYYDAQLGRFVQPDPVIPGDPTESSQVLNRYTYALNNPLKFTDPTGNEAWTDSLEFFDFKSISQGNQAVGPRVANSSSGSPVTTNGSSSAPGVPKNGDNNGLGGSSTGSNANGMGRTFIILTGQGKDKQGAKSWTETMKDVRNYEEKRVVDQYSVSGRDKIVNKEISTAHEVVDELNNNKNIKEISITTHSGPGALYVNMTGKGKDTNIKGTNYSHGYKGVTIEDLPTQNLLPDATVRLNGCDAAKYPDGFAQELANHMNVPVRASQTKVNYEETGEPFVRELREWRSGDFIWTYPQNKK